ncbi:unnamed protein product, partial [Didymodactylos carnosus]
MGLSQYDSTTPSAAVGELILCTASPKIEQDLTRRLIQCSSIHNEDRARLPRFSYAHDSIDGLNSWDSINTTFHQDHYRKVIRHSDFHSDYGIYLP